MRRVGSANYKNSRSSDNTTKWSLTIVTVVFLIEFLLPSALSSYGVFFNEFVEDDCFTFHDALWTPVVFIAFCNIFNPWSRKVGESYGNNKQILKLIAIAGALIMSLGIGLSTLVKKLVMQVTFYGAIGGAGASIALVQIKIYAFENFQSKPGTFESILQIAKVISIFIFPHCVLFLTEHFGVFKAQAVYASLLLHAVPIILLLPGNKQKTSPIALSRYRTVPGYLQDSIELPTINNSFDEGFPADRNFRIREKPTGDGDSDSSSSDSSDSYSLEEFKEEMSRPPLPMRLKNDMGVEILPEIPEEDESSDAPSRKISIDIKRLSKISTRIEEIIGKNNRSDSSSMMLGLTDLENGLYNRNNRKNKHKIFKDFPKSSGGCCSPYRKYLFRKRMRFFGDVLYDNFIKPLNTSIKCFYFYPSLCCKTCMGLSYVVFLSIIPHVALVNGANYSVDITEAMFLLTFISVAWCFFLISLPWVINMSKLKIRILHICGLLLTSGSYFMVHLSLSHDMITLSCLVFGLGYGTTSFVEDLVYKESLGVRKWELVVGTLETLSGMLVILSYFIIYMLKLDVYDIFFVFYLSMSVNVVLWIAAPLIKLSWMYFKKRKRDDFFT